MFCPKCGCSIQYLPWRHHRLATGIMNQEGEMEEEYLNEANNYIEFFCPECDELLFDEEDDGNGLAWDFEYDDIDDLIAILQEMKVTEAEVYKEI